MKGKTIAVGMSGGVDSSVAAALLKEQGYAVTGVFIEAYNETGCRTDQDKKDALKAAIKIGIPFTTIDVRKEYKELVVEDFFAEYKRGNTPNPDVVCNREVKFGIFYDWAIGQAQDKLGFGAIATGHYARVAKILNPKLQISNKSEKTNSKLRNRSQFFIQRPKDLTKDQTYFLWDVEPERLDKVLFPLGDLDKAEVREMARKWGLENAEKPDSMGVCMMGELNVREFLREKLGEKKGEILLEGKAVGEHMGMWFYTIGQRIGEGIDKRALKKLGYQTEKMEPLYVVGKNKKSNAVLVGTREECYKKKFEISNMKLVIGKKELLQLVGEGKLLVRIRNLGELVKIKKFEISSSNWTLSLVKPIFAPAPGQAAVVYDAEGRVVAGGIISV